MRLTSAVCTRAKLAYSPAEVPAHRSLETYKRWALQSGMDLGSPVYRGTLFEYQALEALRRMKAGFYAMNRCGGARDHGIDLRGRWATPDRSLVADVVVQCKSGLKLQPKVFREMDGVVALQQPDHCIFPITRDSTAGNMTQRINLDTLIAEFSGNTATFGSAPSSDSAPSSAYVPASASAPDAISPSPTDQLPCFGIIIGPRHCTQESFKTFLAAKQPMLYGCLNSVDLFVIKMTPNHAFRHLFPEIDFVTRRDLRSGEPSACLKINNEYAKYKRKEFL